MTTITAEQAFRKAYERYAAGDYGQAETICRAIVSAAPECSDAAYLLAIIANRNGRHEEGDVLLERAVANKGFSINLEGSPPSAPRHVLAPHAGLETVMLRDVHRHIERLRSFGQCLPQLERIPVASDGTVDSPHWNNPWIPPLDGVALYGMVALRQPRRYVEVGSGNSTKFVRRAISDHRLATTMVSIDPHPRAEIDALCDVVIRTPLEETDLKLFSGLGAGDMVFIDSSHRCFMNSDVTVFFTEILPSLASGVTVGVHDIFLPYDYPAEWVGRYYSEQYLLACHLLAGGRRCNVLLPAYFLTRHPAAGDALSALSSALPGAAPMQGCSFWFEVG